MVFFGSSKHTPSWTPGSFPAGPMQVMVPGYPGYPYSSSAVWQPQPFMAYPPSPMIIPVQVPVPVHVPVQVPVPVHVPVPTPVAISSPALTPGPTFTLVQPTPSTNTLLLEMPVVPSPRITHAIPPAPPPAPLLYHSPRPPPPPPPHAPDQWNLSQLQQSQVFSVTPQQQQHGSPQFTFNLNLTTPLQGQTLLPPGSTPGPAPAPVLPSAFVHQPPEEGHCH